MFLMCPTTASLAPLPGINDLHPHDSLDMWGRRSLCMCLIPLENVHLVEGMQEKHEDGRDDTGHDGSDHEHELRKIFPDSFP